MKLKYIFWVLIALSLTTYGQNVGIGTSSPNAALDVNAANNGILIPRVALTGTGSASPLTSPTTSTMVYNTATAGSGATAVSPGFYYWNGSAWVRVIDNNSLSGATTVSNTSGTNTLSTTVNGVTGTGVNIINSNALGLTGNNLTATINGIGSSAQSLSGLSLSGDVTGTLAGSTVGKIQGEPVSAAIPTAGQVLEYIGSIWTPTSPTLGTVTSIATTAPLTGGAITGSGTIGISQATTSTNGYLSSTDWNTFNNKQGTVSLTTTGNSGAATFSSNTLNIPNYTLSGLGGQAALTAGNGITISSNIISDNLWTASSTNIYNANSGNVGIGTTTPLALLSVGAGSLSDANLPVQMSTGGTGTQAWYAVNKNGAYGLLMGYSNGPLGTQAIIRQVTTDPLAFYVNNTTQAVTILSSGNVGIGTASPQTILDANGVINSATGYRYANTSYAAGNYLRSNGTNFVPSTIQPGDINYYNFSASNGGSAQWINLGTISLPQGGYNAFIEMHSGSGYNASNAQNGYVNLYIRTSNGSSVDGNGFGASAFAECHGYDLFITNIVLVANAAGASASSYTVYVYAGAYIGTGWYSVRTSGGGWANAGTPGTPSGTTGSSTVCVVTLQTVVQDGFAVMGGNVGIGTISPQTSLHVNNTDAAIIPVGTTAQRPAITVAGGIRFNSSINTFEIYDGANWISLVPVGTILAFGGTTIPTGWMLCNGTAVSRATYSALFAAIGTAYGYGNNSTTFNIPDLRGVFLRGVDGGVGRDPDAASRTALNTGGNTGANIGSYQADQLASHTHLGNVSGGAAANGSTMDVYTGGGVDAGNNFQLRMSSAGGNESRGKNVYVNYIIKY
jgi:microcystin-dependent protein